jgi:hypothetical protein
LRREAGFLLVAEKRIHLCKVCGRYAPLLILLGVLICVYALCIRLLRWTLLWRCVGSGVCAAWVQRCVKVYVYFVVCKYVAMGIVKEGSSACDKVAPGRCASAGLSSVGFFESCELPGRNVIFTSDYNTSRIHS